MWPKSSSTAVPIACHMYTVELHHKWSRRRHRPQFVYVSHGYLLITAGGQWLFVCRKTMALPFLPAASIPLAFQDVVDNNRNSQLMRHLEYVRVTWVESTVWPPSTWSVFRQPVRTNNDVEGWHCRLNVKVNHGRLNLYQLIQLLHAESQLVDISENAVGMWHDAFTEERVQQAAFKTPPAVERILRRQPRCRTAAQCLRSCHELHIGIGLIPRNSREGGSLAPPPITPLSPPSHISGKFCDNSFCVILQNKQSENITSLAELTSTATFVFFLLISV